MSMISVRAHNAHAPVFTKRMRAPLSLSLSLSNMATEHGVVMFGSLKVGDTFDSFDDVQHKIKEIEDATAVQ